MVWLLVEVVRWEILCCCVDWLFLVGVVWFGVGVWFVLVKEVLVVVFLGLVWVVCYGSRFLIIISYGCVVIGWVWFCLFIGIRDLEIELKILLLIMLV